MITGETGQVFSTPNDDKLAALMYRAWGKYQKVITSEHYQYQVLKKELENDIEYIEHQIVIIRLSE